MTATHTLRVDKTFNKRSNSDVRTRAKKYYLAFEGSVTEIQYINGLIDYRDEIGINVSFDIIPLTRFTAEKSNSSPHKWALPLLLKTIAEYKSEKMSVSTLVSHGVEWAVESCMVRGKNNSRQLRETRMAVIAEFERIGYASDYLIDESELEVFCQILFTQMCIAFQKNSHKTAIQTLKQYVQNQRRFYSERSDKACLIIDRDEKSFKPAERYDDVVADCDKHKISLYVSNPRFEFWILLHSEDIGYVDVQRIKEDSDYLDKCIKEAFPAYSKTSIHFENFKDKIRTAIRNESLFCEDVKLLKTEVGSNLGLFVHGLLT